MQCMPTFQPNLDWITAAYGPFGVTDFSMWSGLAGHHASELDAFDAVFIGGGNTFSLLREIRQSGIEDGLKAYVRGGKAVVGGSAGAAIWGRDIHTVDHLDRNDIALSNTEGLNMAEGHSIWVHYRPEDNDLIRAYVRAHRHPVLAISERTSVVVETTGMRIVGFEPVYRFDDRGITVLQAAQGSNL